jgi:hypothetical protein
MRVTFSEALTVTGSAELARAGQLRLIAGERPLAYTQGHTPDATGYATFRDNLDRRTVTMDDGSDTAFPDPIIYPEPELTAEDTVRVGDRVAGLAGMVDGRGAAYRIHPTAPPDVITGDARPAAPAPSGGNVRAAFLDLNDYFTPVGSSYGDRGASSAAELERQRNKLLAALLALDADIIGVGSIENDGSSAGSALADLVTGLNARTAAGTYATLDSGLTWGSGLATIGLMYRTSRVTPIGAAEILDSGAFSQTSPEPTHVPPLAQTFEDAIWGERFTVVVNQWHERDRCPATGSNIDQGDGQGCWSAARAEAADDLAVWLATDPTGYGDPDTLVLGALNAFRLEDPLRALRGQGYEDMIERFAGTAATTSLWGDEAGCADHALVSASLARQALGAGTWSINADEPQAIDYQTENKSAAQIDSLYAPDAFRSSDRDPVFVDLSLLPDQGDLVGDYGVAWHTGQGVWRLGAAWGDADDGVLAGESSWNDGQAELTVNVSGPPEQYACLHAWFDFGDGDTQAGIADTPNGRWDGNEKVIDGLVVQSGSDQPVSFALPVGVVSGGSPLNLRVRLAPAVEPLLPRCAEVSPEGRIDGGEVEDWPISFTPLAVNLSSFEAAGLPEPLWQAHFAFGTAGQMADLRSAVSLACLAAIGGWLARRQFRR